MDIRLSSALSVDSVLDVLADPTRRSVVELLSQRPHRAGELADQVGVSPQVMSRHLRVLRANQVVAGQSGEDDFRVRVYTLRPERLAELQSWLDQMWSFWSEQLGSFQNQVVKQKGGSQ